MKKLISVFIFSIVSLNAAAQLTYDDRGYINTVSPESQLGASVQKAIAYKLGVSHNDPLVLKTMESVTTAYAKYLYERSGSNISGLNSATLLNSVMYTPDMTQYLIQDAVHPTPVQQPKFEYNGSTYYLSPYFYPDGRVETSVSYCPNMIAGSAVSLTKNGNNCYNDQGTNYGPATSMWGYQWLGSNGLSTYPQLTAIDPGFYGADAGGASINTGLLADFATNLWAMATGETGYAGADAQNITQADFSAACATFNNFCPSMSDLAVPVTDALPMGAYKATVSANPTITATSTTSSGSSGSGGSSAGNATSIGDMITNAMNENKLAVLAIGLGLISLVALQMGIKSVLKTAKAEKRAEVAKLNKQEKNAWRVIGKQRKYAIKKAEAEHKKNFVGPIVPKRFR